MELFAAFAGLAPARGGQAVALAWKGLRPDAGLTHTHTLSQCDRTPSSALAKVGFVKGLFGRVLRALLVNILVVNILVAPRSVNALGRETF